MAGTYTALYYHLVFSTKNREPSISADLQPRLWSYIGGIARESSMAALQVGGTADHVHILLTIPKTMPLSQALQLIKGGSSKWVHEMFPERRSFCWQGGYGAFTVSRGDIDNTIAYIRSQHEHHGRRSFQDEYLDLLRRHDVPWDEQHIWK